jgi:NDP-sugar pyrophosphorylase family protein
LDLRFLFQWACSSLLDFTPKKSEQHQSPITFFKSEQPQSLITNHQSLLMKAMLFAAGLGTRLRPLTNEIPKALVPVNGVPLIDLVISKLQRSGVTELVLNVHYFAEKLIAHLSSREWGMKIHISHEKDLLLETGGGLLFAKEHFINESSFLVLNVDILTDLDIAALFENHKTNNALATLAVQKRNSSRLFLFY